MDTIHCETSWGDRFLHRCKLRKGHVGPCECRCEQAHSRVKFPSDSDIEGAPA